MQAQQLDRKAFLRRLIAKLRADCLYYGTDPDHVRRMSLEQLIAERKARLKDLIESTPRGRAWDA